MEKSPLIGIYRYIFNPGQCEMLWKNGKVESSPILPLRALYLYWKVLYAVK